MARRTISCCTCSWLETRSACLCSRPATSVLALALRSSSSVTGISYVWAGMRVCAYVYVHACISALTASNTVYTWKETSVMLAGPMPSTRMESLSSALDRFLSTTSQFPFFKSTFTTLVTYVHTREDSRKKNQGLSYCILQLCPDRQRLNEPDNL